MSCFLTLSIKDWREPRNPLILSGERLTQIFIVSNEWQIFSSSVFAFLFGQNPDFRFRIELSLYVLFLKWYDSLNFLTNSYTSFSKPGISASGVGVNVNPSKRSWTSPGSKINFEMFTILTVFGCWVSATPNLPMALVDSVGPTDWVENVGFVDPSDPVGLLDSPDGSKVVAVPVGCRGIGHDLVCASPDNCLSDSDSEVLDLTSFLTVIRHHFQ